MTHIEFFQTLAVLVPLGFFLALVWVVFVHWSGLDL